MTTPINTLANSHNYVIKESVPNKLEALLSIDQKEAVKLLEEVSLSEKWNHLLNGQAKIQAPHDLEWLDTQNWWNLKNPNENTVVLDIGSGNGAYLSQMQEHCLDKKFISVEKNDRYISQCNERNINCSYEDIEIIKHNHPPCYDIITLRLVLQHLKQPINAIQNAVGRLKPGGVLFIIDSYDPVRNESHQSIQMQGLQERLKIQMQNQNKNREFSFEFYKNQTLNPDPQINILYSNINTEGKLTGFNPIFSEEHERTTHFNNMLLISSIFKEQFHIDTIDLEAMHQEFKSLLKEESYWVQYGVHYLVLQKTPE
ncbi:MAG: methyltransferase domain-containing protein [Chlamydiota bacterium]|nr:methyltransferase domain-containing protein [Chlamydiota bacterium]